MSRLGLKSIHATMPLNFSSNTKAAIDSLVEAITGVQYEINTAPTPFNKPGQAKGELMGGNLSILYSLLGTNDHADFKGSILFIEDLAEHIYAIDRMFYALKKTGVLHQINGLIVGGMTGLKDTTVPFGKSYQEVILSHFEGRDIPICFDFPAGHIDDNRALVFGADVEFTATKRDVTLIF
jgi:muramoyltetrapeptide carboxypeptidase